MFKNMRFKYRILLIPVLTNLAFLYGLLLIMTTGNRNINQIDTLINANIPALNSDKEFLQGLDDVQRTLESAVAAHNIETLRGVQAKKDNLFERMEAERSGIKTKIASFDSLKNEFDGYCAFATNVLTRLIHGEGGEKFSQDMESMTARYGALKSRLESDLTVNQKRLTDAGKMMRDRNRFMILATVLGMSLFVVFSIVLSFWSVKSITKPIDSTIGFMNKIADGDLSIQIPESTSRDEGGVLLTAFKKMVDNLKGITDQIKEATTAHASASTEISASVTEIASGATETATAANETSTTVEEVRQTAMDSNRKAKHVSESAQKAVQISQSGEKAVAATIEGMRRIESQMESIAESIMKLSEHGQAIGGIIATVEDVAEQSNLLAVNASIEAARAGEHGKGFAVVAQEVKSLAEQSKQATSKVRNILDDIQKATSGAVMTTEQGSKAVEAGVRQSMEAGDSIQRLANGVAEAAQATTQISVSSQEQVVGMDQVVSAMESIKQASSQNVTATRQVESAAHDLQELGQRLKHMVEQFRL
jgi:methyl-accepting chemotaxis protein